jgi:hypothetical protein
VTAVADRVDRGLAWIVEYGEVDGIDLDKLDVSDPYGCPLAQASGTSFASACARFALSSADTFNLGFEGCDGDPADGRGFWADVIALNDEWVRRIRLSRLERNHLMSLAYLIAHQGEGRWTPTIVVARGLNDGKNGKRATGLAFEAPLTLVGVVR